jgi:3-oxoacyl-[acyl-carrier protein] reductase
LRSARYRDSAATWAGSPMALRRLPSLHICKVLAVELSGQGIMVNAIAPGPIETGISKHGPSRRQGYLDRIPTRSYGNVDAVANAALYLASDECDWITGHVLNVDGGYGAAGLSYDPTEICG